MIKEILEFAGKLETIFRKLGQVEQLLIVLGIILVVFLGCTTSAILQVITALGLLFLGIIVFLVLVKRISKGGKKDGNHI